MRRLFAILVILFLLLIAAGMNGRFLRSQGSEYETGFRIERDPSGRLVFSQPVVHNLNPEQGWLEIRVTSESWGAPVMHRERWVATASLWNWHGNRSPSRFEIEQLLVPLDDSALIILGNMHRTRPGVADAITRFQPGTYPQQSDYAYDTDWEAAAINLSIWFAIALFVGLVWLLIDRVAIRSMIAHRKQGTSVDPSQPTG